MKRAEKIALLQSLLTGNATPQQVNYLRKSRETIHVTMILDEADTNLVQDDPQYCIVLYKDGTTRCFDKYADGREVDRV